MPDARQNGNFLRQNKTQKQHKTQPYNTQTTTSRHCGLWFET